MDHTFVISEDVDHEGIKIVSLADEKGMSNLGMFTILKCGIVQYFHLDNVIEFALGTLELDGAKGAFKAETQSYSGKGYINCFLNNSLIYLKDGKAVGVIDFQEEKILTFED